ncbi:hypothetical protein ISCGN_023349 [Ixodes scapularis]
MSRDPKQHPEPQKLWKMLHRSKRLSPRQKASQVFIALNSIVGEKGLFHLQHHAGSNFLAGTSSTQAAGKLVAQGGELLNNLAVSLEQVSPHIIYVSVFRLPPYVPDDAIQAVLGVYSKILGFSEPTYKQSTHRFTGTMVLRIETAKAAPNVVYVASHHVMCESRGMKWVCSRCCPGGHFEAACRTPRCNRCGIFGHGTEGCSSPCRWCGHSHDMSDCTLPRSYSALAPAARPPNAREPSTDIAASAGATGNSRKPAPSHPQLSCK